MPNKLWLDVALLACVKELLMVVLLVIKVVFLGVRLANLGSCV